MDIRKPVIPALVLASAFSLGFSSTLSAADLDYTYFEGRYILDGEVEDVDDYDGFALAGSYQLTNDIFVFGQYFDGEFDDIDGDLSSYLFGAGYIYPLNESWDANFSFGYGKYEIDTRRGDVDDNGFVLTGGVRGMFKPKIELRADLNYSKFDESDTYLTLGGDYYFMPNVSAGIAFNIGGDSDSFSIGGRYYFK
jgi:hypothetical protein